MRCKVYFWWWHTAEKVAFEKNIKTGHRKTFRFTVASKTELIKLIYHIYIELLWTGTILICLRLISESSISFHIPSKNLSYLFPSVKHVHTTLRTSEKFISANVVPVTHASNIRAKCAWTALAHCHGRKWKRIYTHQYEVEANLICESDFRANNTEKEPRCFNDGSGQENCFQCWSWTQFAGKVKKSFSFHRPYARIGGTR